MLQDVAIIAVVLAIVGAVASHLVRARKRGEHCIGCPYAKQCGGACGADQPCAQHPQNQERSL